MVSVSRRKRTVADHSLPSLIGDVSGLWVSLWFQDFPLESFYYLRFFRFSSYSFLSATSHALRPFLTGLRILVFGLLFIGAFSVGILYSLSEGCGPLNYSGLATSDAPEVSSAWHQLWISSLASKFGNQTYEGKLKPSAQGRCRSIYKFPRESFVVALPRVQTETDTLPCNGISS